jgi:GNAT superfamily N-acetyltransferase
LSGKLIVRQATEHDLPTTDALLRKWLNFRKERKMSFRQALRNTELIVAERDGGLLGFIRYVIHNDIIDGGLNAFITAFYVTPNHRRKGIGSALLTRAIQDALRKGVVGIESSTTNPEARRLYEKYGFKQYRGEVFLEMDMAFT